MTAPPPPRRNCLIHLSSAFDHRFGVEFTCPFPGSVCQSPAQGVVGDKSRRGGGKGISIPGGYQYTALAVLDYLRKTTHRECDRGHPERHGVYDGRTQPLGPRRMPEQVEAGNRIVDLRDESRVEGFESGGDRLALALAAKENEPRPGQDFGREAARNCRDRIETFFPCHRSNHSAHDRVFGPAALSAPVTRLADLRGGDSGVNHPNAIRRDTGCDHCGSHRFGDRDESVNAPSVFEPDALRRKRDASSDYQTRFSPEKLSQQPDRVRARVMRVNDVGAPLPGDGAQLARAPYIPLASQRETVGG